MVRVLFVCMGNICRSPVAQGVFESVARREGLAGDIEVDSAGTHGYYHAGEPPDPRAQWPDPRLLGKTRPGSPVSLGTGLPSHRSFLG
jgi:hypothetical protein